MSPYDRDILRALHEYGGWSATSWQIAQHVEWALEGRSVAPRLVSMERRGLVQRDSSIAGYSWRLTDAGRAALVNSDG